MSLKLRLTTRFALITIVSLVVLAAALAQQAASLVTDAMTGMAQQRQSSNMAVAWQVLQEHGTTFRLVDGKLYAGDTLLNGDVAIVDTIQKLVGGTATIFAGDTRVATNVRKDDGSRAVGTPLAQGPVHSAVLGSGTSFRGEANILGKDFYTAYDPIRDASGKVIGVLYVGLEKAEFQQVVDALVLRIVLVAGALVVVAGGIVWWLLRREFRALHDVRASMRAISHDETALTVPHLARHDEIGEMAQAVEVFRQGVIQATDLRRTQQAEADRKLARQQEIETLTARFDQAVGRLMGNVESSIESLRSAAGSLDAGAAHTAERSVRVATASEQASANVQTV
ncbi:cache domain-containing protein, partial [Caenispirillum bisanense]|uniref:cache domain-containing protein n=1 Tax=Caenispirillum bisanense TaxID=414052 RepID=UPI0031E284DC